METKELTIALIPHAERISRDCLPLGRKMGNYWKAGSVHGEKGESLVVTLNKGNWTDFNSDEHSGNMLNLIFHTLANEDWAEAYKIAKNYIGFTNYKNTRNIDLTVAAKKKKPEIRTSIFAQKIWRAASLIIGDPGLKYFKSRKLFIPEYHTDFLVRFVDELKHPDGKKYPALIFRLTNSENKFCGIQRIYLTVDGQKIPMDAKLTLGDVLGATLKLGRYKPEIILVTEGIEDGYSLNPLSIKHKNLGVWSGVGAKQLWGMEVPDYVETIIICADNDEITETIIERLVEKFGDKKKVIAHLPPQKFKDFNQFLNDTSGYKIDDHFKEILSSNI